MSPMGDKIQSPLANRYLVGYNLARSVLTELRQSNVRIEKSVQCFRAPGQSIQITFENFGKAVEQCPERPGVELLVSRIPPLSQDRWDLPWGAGPNVCRADDEIVGRGI